MVLIHPFEFGTCNHPTFESGCWPAPARNSRRPSCDPFVRPSSYPQHSSRDSPARAAHCSRQSRACSTPFVSAPSSPARDPSLSAAGCFYSAANPAPMMSMAASWGSTSISTSRRAARRQRRPRCPPPTSSSTTARSGQCGSRPSSSARRRCRRSTETSPKAIRRRRRRKRR